MSWIFKRPGSPYWYFADKGLTPFSLKTSDKATAEAYQTERDYNKTRGRLSLPNDRLTYSAYKFDHEKYIANFEPATRQIYTYALGSFERIAGIPDRLMDVKPETIQAWFNDRSKEFDSPTSANIELRHLKAFFNHAVKLGLAAENPAKPIHYLEEDKKLEASKPPFLSKKQIRILLKATQPNPQINLMANIFIYSGRRLQETTHMRWQDVKFDSNYTEVRSWGGWKLKDHEERDIPIGANLFKVLKRAAKDSELICPGQDGLRNEDSVAQAFNRLYERLGLPFSGVKVLRHTFASHCVMSGVDIHTLQKWMGHASPNTTMVYTHLNDEHQQDSIKKITF